MMQPNREKIEVAPLLETILAEKMMEIERKKIDFNLEVAEEVGAIWADKAKLERCLEYLVSHAVKNIQQNGKMVIRLAGSEKYVRLEICGADSENFGDRLRKIFDIFEDIKTNRGEQVGMWMYVLKDIIEFHHGKIWVEDESSNASKCVLCLPRDLRKKVKIVIADDNPGIRQTLRDILTEKEYQVDTVENGYELIAYLRENNPKIVILDMMMPEKDGTEVFNTIRSIQSGIKIIIYTGFQRYENSVYAHSAEKFLLKDENPEKLLRAIEELM
ncbi:MAG: response regulator [Candidatus Omnitrophica bacterium]|nr:response regulator [Candidatus Omnitrophota bacterium]